jgi:hypothetical protein
MDRLPSPGAIFPHVLNRASVPLIRPLILHHLTVAGRLPLAGTGAGPAAAELRATAHRWAIRQHRLDEVLLTAAEHFLPPPVLVQGTGLAPLYPSPALRTTADLDLLVAQHDVAAWKQHLLHLGWMPTPGNWIHPDGTNLDLHIPLSPLAGAILRSSIPHPRVPHARLPADALHLVLIARHAARHQADRLWRDVSDVNLLLGRASNVRRLLADAWDAAPDDTREPLAGLLRFVDRWSTPLTPAWRGSQLGGEFLRLCQGQALTRQGAAELDLLEGVIHPSPSTRKLRRATEGTTITRRVDSQLGAIPRPGMGLTALKLRLLLRAIASGKLPRLRTRIARRRAARIVQSDFA